MGFLSDIWNSITGAFQAALEFFHDFLEPIFGFDPAWGWAIIVVTLIVRIALLPLAIKQTRSMRAMQELQPKIKKIQERYPADRALAKKDPEFYRKRKAEQNEKMMALYQEEGVNPAASCLPLVAQAPIFFALFSVLRSTDFTALQDAQFYFITDFVSSDADAAGLGALVNQSGWPGIALIGLMIATTFITQRQMMARTGGVTGPQAQQQKIMLYVLPGFLGFISFTLPLGVILYWVTTNAWQGVQQWIIFRDKQSEQAKKEPDESTAASNGTESSGSSKAKKDSKSPKQSDPKSDAHSAGADRNGESNDSAPDKPSSGKQSDEPKPGKPKRSGGGDHLPRKRR